MHAIVTTFKLSPENLARQRKDLEERLVPLWRHQPGFVSGTWTYDGDGGRGYTLLVVDSETTARKLVDLCREQAARPGAPPIEAVSVTEVLAEVRR